MSWWTYIVRTARGHLYTGVATDVQRRVHQHNHVQERASKKCWSERPVELVWSRQEKSKSDAYKAEARIKKLSRVKKEKLIDAGRQERVGVAVRDAVGQHPVVGGEAADVIPSIEELIRCVKADPVTSNCTEEILERHRRIGALEIRKLLMRYGVEEGWRRAKLLFSKPVQCMTRLNRELTDDELAILEEALGYEFDRSGYPLGGRRVDHLRRGDGGGRRGLHEGEGRKAPGLGEE